MAVFAGSEVLFWPGVPSSAWLPVPVAGLSSWFLQTWVLEIRVGRVVQDGCHTQLHLQVQEIIPGVFKE